MARIDRTKIDRTGRTRPAGINRVRHPLPDLPPVDFWGVRAELACYFEEASWQMRKTLHRDDRLDRVAQRRAVHIALTGEFEHWETHSNGAGESWRLHPNELVFHTGYKLPWYYPRKANTVEAIAMGYGSPVRALKALLRTPYYANYLAGFGFWADHLYYGAGYAWMKNRKTYVMITAPQEANDDTNPADPAE